MIFLLFGSAIWFWLAFIVLVALDIFFIEIDHGWACTAGLILFIGAVLYWGETSLFSWISENPFLFLGGFAAYIPTGILLGWKLEWPLFLKRKSLEHREQRRDFLRGRGISDATLDTPIPAEHIEYWNRGYRSDNWRFASKNKGKIISLMSWWPIALTRTLFREPFLTAYNLLAVHLQADADKEAKKIGLLDDLATATAVNDELVRKANQVRS